MIEGIQERNVMIWSDEQITQWHHIKQQYHSDTISATIYKNVHQQRIHAQREMLELLRTFFDGATTLKEFNQVFQQRTHKAWNIFHLRGMSGGLFLNKLIKYVPGEESFAHLLRMILHVPSDMQNGQRHMHALINFLEEIIVSKQAERWQIQPARVPFFVSVWWHLQEPEQWPIFYFEVRRAFLSEKDVSNHLKNPIDAYFMFRTRFLALKQILELSAWELEQLIIWHGTNSSASKGATPAISTSHQGFLPSNKSVEVNNDKRPSATIIYSSTVSRKGSMVYKKGQREASHTYIQWLLAKIGLKIGCSVWIAINDHEKVWNEEKLKGLSLPSLPILAESTFQQIIQHIDVLWLRKNEIIAAYEVEPTTIDISKSLLRLADLAVLFPKCNMQLCVVTPQRCFDTVQSELTRPIFQDHDIHKRSKIIIQEHLVRNAEHILRWANSPSVLHDLTLYLSTKE